MADLKTTLVIGASTNPSRYSFLAINALRNHGHPVFAYGLRAGTVSDVPINTHKENFTGIHTITLYVGPKNQTDLFEYIEGLKPQRVIFNPGTENPEFETRLRVQGIHVEVACTLVMLSTDQF